MNRVLATFLAVVIAFAAPANTIATSGEGGFNMTMFHGQRATRGIDGIGTNDSVPITGLYPARRVELNGQTVVEVLAAGDRHYIPASALEADETPEQSQATAQAGGAASTEASQEVRHTEISGAGQHDSCANVNVDEPRFPEGGVRHEPRSTTPREEQPPQGGGASSSSGSPGNPGGSSTGAGPAGESGGGDPIGVPPRATGYPPSSTSPVLHPEVAVNLTMTSGTLGTIAAQEERREFLDAVLEARRAVHLAASSDNETLSTPYRRMPVEALGQHLERAAQVLGDATRDLEQANGGLPAGELARFRNLYMNARDKAALGAGSIREEAERNRALGAGNPFAGLLAPGGGSAALAKTETLREIFGAEGERSAASAGSRGAAPARAATNEALMNRLVMFNGLLQGERAQLLKRLKLAEQANLSLADGRSVSIPILHNGYIFGGGATGLDCSSFVSSALPPEIRKGRFTTLDFRQMWVYRRTGDFPAPPKYDAARARLVQETANAFTPLNIYDGDRLVTGDLLIYRTPWEAAGHVFVVRGYDPRKMQAEVIEAAQSAGTVRERDFPLSLDPPEAKRRHLRPGLFALRIKPTSNRVCTTVRPDTAGAVYQQRESGPRRPSMRPTGHDQKGGGPAL
jgi:hypothetical protein